MKDFEANITEILINDLTGSYIGTVDTIGLNRAFKKIV